MSINTVFDVRGTNGSGKSTLVREVLKRWDNKLVLDEEIPYHYVYGLNLCVLGRYDMKGSGIDNVKGSDRIQEFMWKLLENHSILIEGVIVSHVFKRWNDMALEAENKGCAYKFYHLDVPIDKAIDRVKDRREKAGKEREYDPTNTERFDVQTRRTISKLKESGCDITIMEDMEVDEKYDWLISDILDARLTDIEPFEDRSVLDLRGNHGSGKTTIIKHLCKAKCKKVKSLATYYVNEELGFAVIPNFGKKMKEVTKKELKGFLIGLLERYHLVVEGVPSKNIDDLDLWLLEVVNEKYTILILDETNEECYRRKNKIYMNKKGKPYDKFKIVSEGKEMMKACSRFASTKASMLIQSKRTKKDTYKRVVKIIKNFS